ncbi:MAG: amidophosphoribosyltransferase [Candidatus Diapherotrites archaeon]|nr:amidophosphoribosyltransferase [Candidatus Diapherotrites archaeon]
MEEFLGHNCGIAAVSLPSYDKPSESASGILYKMLLRLQNRGQLSAGITTYNPERLQLIDTFKKVGLVNEVFSTNVRPKFENILKDYAGTKGIGHVRYATCGGDDDSFAQPFERHHNRKWKWFSFAFNGNIANYNDLKKQMEQREYHFVRNFDTELLMLLLARQLKGDKRPEFAEMFKGVSEAIDGAYSMVFLNAEGELVAARDPLGIKPLCYSEVDGKVLVSSETSALLSDPKAIDVKPGELIIVHDGIVERKQFAKSPRKAHCMFEWIYFASASSILDEVSVYETRWRLGKELAKIEPLETNSSDFVVVPVPDTAKPAADSFARELGLASMEGLLRNRFVGRTFIEGDSRSDKANEKYTIVKPIVEGKKVLLVEDSIVRGTTGKALINYIREKGGAKEVHVRVSCPAVRFPCFYGIDMSTLNELIAARLSMPEERSEGIELSEETVEKIRKELGADSLVYQTFDGLVKAIGMPKEDLCLACLNGKYPTPKGTELSKKAKACFGTSGKRTYEC